MDRAEFTLSRPVCLSLPVEEVDKLLREKDGRCALTYLALLRAGGKPFPAESIGLTERELHQTMERLCALGLVSACFEWELQDGNFVFYVTGHGHGVGLSQYGADAMAEAGADYREILTHYYTGVTVAVYAG